MCDDWEYQDIDDGELRDFIIEDYDFEKITKNTAALDVIKNELSEDDKFTEETFDDVIGDLDDDVLKQIIFEMGGVSKFVEGYVKENYSNYSAQKWFDELDLSWSSVDDYVNYGDLINNIIDDNF